MKEYFIKLPLEKYEELEALLSPDDRITPSIKVEEQGLMFWTINRRMIVFKPERA